MKKLRNDMENRTNAVVIPISERGESLGAKVTSTASTPKVYTTPRATSTPTVSMASSAPTTPTASTKVYTPDYQALDSSFQALVDSYDSQKGDLKAQNATDKTSLANSFQQMLDSLTTSRKDNKTALQTSAGTISEYAYSKSRQIDAYMTSKGLGASGISELAGIQNRMATGEAVSKVANSFYKAEEALTKQEAGARQNYDTTLQTLNNSLQSAINKISTSVATDKLSFQQTVDNLKRQVVSDTNSALQAERAYAQAQEQLALSRYSAYKASSASSSANSAPVGVAVQTILENTTETNQMKIAGLMDLGYDQTKATDMIVNYSSPSSAFGGGSDRTVDTTVAKPFAKVTLPTSYTGNNAVAGNTAGTNTSATGAKASTTTGYNPWKY